MIELQVVGKDAKYFFVRNKGSADKYEQKKIKKEIDSALKLKELIKKIIKGWEDDPDFGKTYSERYIEEYKALCSVLYQSEKDL